MAEGQILWMSAQRPMPSPQEAEEKSCSGGTGAYPAVWNRVHCNSASCITLREAGLEESRGAPEEAGTRPVWNSWKCRISLQMSASVTFRLPSTRSLGSKLSFRNRDANCSAIAWLSSRCICSVGALLYRSSHVCPDSCSSSAINICPSLRSVDRSFTRRFLCRKCEFTHAPNVLACSAITDASFTSLAAVIILALPSNALIFLFLFFVL